MSIINKTLELLHEQGKSQADICKHLGIKQNVFTTWKTRGTDPPAKFIVRICEFFNVSLEYLLIDEENEIKKGKFNINMGSNNTYNGTVNNATGKTVTVNNVISSNPETTQKNQEYNGRYSTVIMYLDSLDEKNKRHAIVDVEYMLESEYCVSENTNKQSGNTDYQRIIAYLDSLDEKTCRHAVVDVEYLLEVEYGVKKKQ